MLHNLLIETCDFIDLKRQQQLQVDIKSSPQDLVTNADKETEAFLTSGIKELFPNTKILGEESNQDIDLSVGETWIIDPIDGTTNFYKQNDHYGIILTRVVDGELVEGYLCHGKTRDIYHAVKGEGVTKNKEVFERDYDESLNETLISISPKFILDKIKDPKELIRNTLGIRYIGSCCVDSISVIEEGLGAYAILICQIWDIAATLLFAEELGLVCLNLDGTQRRYDEDRPFIFGQKKVVQQLLEHIKV